MAKRLLRARDYQDPREPIRRIADANRAKIRRDLFEALRHLRELVNVELIKTLIRNGLFWKVKDQGVDWQKFGQIMRAPFDRIAETFEEGGRLGARKLSGKFHQDPRGMRYRRPHERGFMVAYKSGENLDIVIEKDIGDRFTFDRFNAVTQDKLRRSQDELIAELTDTSRDAIDQLIYQGATRGYDADQIARNIRNYIGLTDRQATAVDNYARLLSNLDPQALERRLRNTAYDGVVQDAIDSGSFMSAKAVDRLVEDYADNYLDYRAATIAITESSRAANEGLQDGYRQAIDNGALPTAAIKRFWKLAIEEKACEVCKSIVERNEGGVGVDEPFDSIDGPVMNPPDPHPRCACSVEYVTDLDLVPDDYEKAFNPNQPRDERGRWSETGAGDDATGTDGPGVHAVGLQASDDLKKEWAKKNPAKDIDTIMDTARGDQEELREVASRLGALGGTPYRDPGVKGRARLAEKIAAGRSANEITDAVRGGFAVDSPEQADQIVRGLSKHFGVADEGWNHTPAGYFDRKVMVRFKSGMVGEVQFWPPGMYEAKEQKGGHQLYEKYRALPPKSPAAPALESQMRDLYGGTLRQLPPSWNAVVGNRGK